MTDFRALCAELHAAFNTYAVDMAHHNLLERARAALAEHPVAPTPIPVAEQWPEFSDCDPHERVWVWNPFLDHWKLSRIKRSVHTHWLPVNALPVPANV